MKTGCGGTWGERWGWAGWGDGAVGWDVGGSGGTVAGGVNYLKWPDRQPDSQTDSQTPDSHRVTQSPSHTGTQTANRARTYKNA